MKQRVSFYDFRRAFIKCGRLNQFSGEGLVALFAYLEDFERDTGVELDLDVNHLCCHYSEIECTDPDYSKYVGDDAHLSSLVIAKLPNSALIVD